MAHWIIINNVKQRIDAMKGVADILESNWANFNIEEQEGIENILDDCETWATTSGSYPGANVKIEQMCTELEAYLPGQD